MRGMDDPPSPEPGWWDQSIVTSHVLVHYAFNNVDEADQEGVCSLIQV
jgi:hypothetical protein